MVTKESGMSRESHGEEEESPSGQKLLNQINKFHYVLSLSLVNHLYIPSSTHPPNHQLRGAKFHSEVCVTCKFPLPKKAFKKKNTLCRKKKCSVFCLE